MSADPTPGQDERLLVLGVRDLLSNCWTSGVCTLVGETLQEPSRVRP